MWGQYACVQRVFWVLGESISLDGTQALHQLLRTIEESSHRALATEKVKSHSKMTAWQAVLRAGSQYFEKHKVRKYVQLQLLRVILVLLCLSPLGSGSANVLPLTYLFTNHWDQWQQVLCHHVLIPSFPPSIQSDLALQPWTL